MPKISIIIPVYKVESYLNRCIDSILNQTYGDFELILVDDGSPDNSGKICDDYAKKDKRVRAIHKENGGASSARNVGIGLAEGEFIAFIDSDDYIDPNMLKEMTEQSQGSDIVLSGLKYLDIKGNLLLTYVADAFLHIEKKEFVEKHLLYLDKNAILWGPVNKLYKRELIRDNNILFNEAFSRCEDGLFVFEYLKHCKTFTCLNSAYYNYVQYSNSLMSKYNDNAIEACEAFYKARMNFLSDCSKDEAIVAPFEQTILLMFFDLFIQIYTRSRLTSREKYIRLKHAIRNESFSYLVSKYRFYNKRTTILYYSHLLKLDALLHMFLSIKYRVNKKDE